MKSTEKKFCQTNVYWGAGNQQEMLAHKYIIQTFLILFRNGKNFIFKFLELKILCEAQFFSILNNFFSFIFKKLAANFFFKAKFREARNFDFAKYNFVQISCDTKLHILKILV